jgi:DNA primase
MISSSIDETKNRLDITEVIQSYIKVQKAGVNYQALCPFHSEKKPSLFISPARQIWHCFGCGVGGDIFRFVMQIEGVEFGDALRILAQRAGIELKKQDPKLKTERQRLYEICELATEFFEKQLESGKAGEAIKRYLLGRGMSEESMRKWRVGYAPDSWQGLSDFLISQGYKKEEIERVGLVFKSAEGRLCDRFRKRIIFPVFDLNSQVIGFGGRIFQEEGNKRPTIQKKQEVPVVEAKYINTPSTILYDKSRVLYGLDRAKVEIRKNNYCILVEGYIDAIMSSQAGLENVVATSGTALTPHQLKILRRYSENLFTAFDMDIAGDTATKRGIDLAQSQGFNIKVVILPGKDPADVILANSQDWRELIKEAKSILEFYFETTFAKFDKEKPEGKREIAKILLPVIKRIPNKIEQSHWVGRLAREFRIKEEDISEELKKVKLEQKGWFLKENYLANIKQKSRREMLEEQILALALQSPSLSVFIDENIYSCFSPQAKEILISLKGNPNLNLENKISPGSAEFMNYLFLRGETEQDQERDLEREIKTCLKEFYCLEVKNRLIEITQAIKRAEEEKDSEKVSLFTRECNKLIKDLEDKNYIYAKEAQKIKEN